MNTELPLNPDFEFNGRKWRVVKTVEINNSDLNLIADICAPADLTRWSAHYEVFASTPKGHYECRFAAPYLSKELAALPDLRIEEEAQRLEKAREEALHRRIGDFELRALLDALQLERGSQPSTDRYADCHSVWNHMGAAMLVAAAEKWLRHTTNHECFRCEREGLE